MNKSGSDGFGWSVRKFLHAKLWSHFNNLMKKIWKIARWALVVAGVIALPILVKKGIEQAERRNENIRYDINDYLFDLEA